MVMALQLSMATGISHFHYLKSAAELFVQPFDLFLEIGCFP